MCLDFNTELPNLIAAGYYDGSVAVYDLSDKEIKLDKFKISPKNIFKHLEPVWQVRWQKNDVDDNPNFSSISSDGFVLVWTIKNVNIIVLINPHNSLNLNPIFRKNYFLVNWLL
jgi:dynein intermediate chain 1, axonemal